MRTTLHAARRTATVALGGLALVTATVTGSLAGEDELPYVPWSSYLPGWTDEYVPSSENDCVAGRPNCLKATLKELSRIADDTARSCSHDAPFARAYLRMTQLYGHTRQIDGYYDDVPWMNHLDAVFARYYTDAYESYRSGDLASVPRSWRIAFDAAAAKTVTGSGDLLLGMNAHINRDLPYVVAASGLVAPDGSSHKADYVAVERWLYDATGPLFAELAARFDPKMADSQDAYGLGNAVSFQAVSAWRENAWRNAEALVSAPTPLARALVETRIETEANTIAEALKRGQSYALTGGSTEDRDQFCAEHNGDVPPVEYDFGPADAWGYAY